VTPADEAFDCFISLRFGEAADEASALRSALEGRGQRVFICNMSPGGNLVDSIFAALASAKLVILMGSQTYGRRTTTFSTFEELQFTLSEGKNYFLIKMCEHFEEAHVRAQLGDHIMYSMWMPGEPMPNGLVESVLSKLAGLTPARPRQASCERNHIYSSEPSRKTNSGRISPSNENAPSASPPAGAAPMRRWSSDRSVVSTTPSDAGEQRPRQMRRWSSDRSVV